MICYCRQHNQQCCCQHWASNVYVLWICAIKIPCKFTRVDQWNCLCYYHLGMMTVIMTIRNAEIWDPKFASITVFFTSPMRSSNHNFSYIVVINVNAIANENIIGCFYASIVVSKTYNNRIYITSPRLRLHIEIFTEIDHFWWYNNLPRLIWVDSIWGSMYLRW